MTQTIERASLDEAKLAYLSKLGAGDWTLLHDDAEADFSAGFASAVSDPDRIQDAVKKFEADHRDDPMLDLRVEDFAGGFRAGEVLAREGR